MSASPSFQFYPQDFIMGTADMTPEEVGAYIRLLCFQWSKDGLPDDQAKCAAMAGCSGNAVASIWHKFGKCSDGKMRNTRMEAVRAEQLSFRAKQAEKAKKRWKKDAAALPWDVPEGCPSPSPSIVQTNKPPSADAYPTEDEFVSFFLPGFVSYTDFPADAYLRSRHSDFRSTGWKKGQREIVDWQGLQSSLMRDYQNDRNKRVLGGDPNAPRNGLNGHRTPKPITAVRETTEQRLLRQARERGDL